MAQAAVTEHWGKQIFTHWRFPEVGQKQKTQGREKKKNQPKNYFTHGSFPEVGQKQKTEKKEERKKERLNNGNNNGQATHGARKHAWRTQAAWAKRGQKGRIVTRVAQNLVSW